MKSIDLKHRLAWLSSGVLVAFWFMAFLKTSRWHLLSIGLAAAGTLILLIGLAGYLGVKVIKEKADPRDILAAAGGMLFMAINLFLTTH